MNDTQTTHSQPASGAATVHASGAGLLLRQYREAANLHLVTLSAALKVSRAKIEALEADRYDDLPDVAFARALAMSCCRYVGKDPEPVLALMPSHAAQPTAGLRPHLTETSASPSRPSFKLSRGPFAHPTVPPWVIWAFVIAVIVVGGWFAASPQRPVVKAPASALDIPPQGVPGAEPVAVPQDQVSAPSVSGAAPAPSVAAPVSAVPLSPAPVSASPALRVEPVTPGRH